jgi:transcriptional regulator with XRE-family HTH domain
MQYKTFGEWLRHYRLQMEISPFKLAEALGYKRVSAIYNFEYGIAPLPISKWPAMASVLQLSLEEFLKIMERYSAEKVAEFRLIRDTAVPSDGQPVVRMGSLLEEDLSAVSVPIPADLSEERMKTYRLEDADVVLVTRENWEDSLILALGQLRRNYQKKIGLLQVVEETPFPSSLVVSASKEAKTICVIESENQVEPTTFLAAKLKAGFLDALTGADGYPEIHRVPKIFSVLVQPLLYEWTAEGIGDILRFIQENGRRRHVTVKNGTNRFISDKKALTKAAVRG